MNILLYLSPCWSLIYSPSCRWLFPEYPLFSSSTLFISLPSPPPLSFPSPAFSSSPFPPSLASPFPFPLISALISFPSPPPHLLSSPLISFPSPSSRRTHSHDSDTSQLQAKHAHSHAHRAIRAERVIPSNYWTLHQIYRILCNWFFANFIDQ